MSPWLRPDSLRLRLLGATLVSLALALAGAHWWLGGLFREHVLSQFDATLTQQLDQLTARLEFDAAGQPQINPRGLSDPRWERPFSGLYWQVDSVSPGAGGGAVRAGVLRSRSLWDTQLVLAADALDDGALHVHEVTGPRGAALRVLERSVIADQLPRQGQQGQQDQTAQRADPAPRWRLMVAADPHDTLEAVEHFNGVLAASLAALGGLLALAALAQVAVGLAPLQALQRALQRVRDGRAARIEERGPAEVQPLIDDFNRVLDRNAEVVARARTQAGNLAHALKTPLAVLSNAAAELATDTGPQSGLGALVAEQVGVAQRHIDWHLKRARVAAGVVPGQRVMVAPLVAGLLRVMAKVHADRGLDLDATDLPADLAFAGEEQDLQEMLGNLIDNACRSARSRVRVRGQRDADAADGQRMVCVSIEDDGPGIAPEQRAAVLQRGVRLDESRPGSGLGLAIVLELAQLYGGALELDSGSDGDHSGLCARLRLPAGD